MATGGFVTGMVVKIGPSRRMSWFDSTMPWRGPALMAGSQSGGDIMPWMLFWNDRYCSMRNWSGVALPYQTGRYQHGLAWSRARDISRKYDGQKKPGPMS